MLLLSITLHSRLTSSVSSKRLGSFFRPFTFPKSAFFCFNLLLDSFSKYSKFTSKLVKPHKKAQAFFVHLPPCLRKKIRKTHNRHAYKTLLKKSNYSLRYLKMGETCSSYSYILL